MLGNFSVYDKSINGVKFLSDGQVYISNGNITNVSDIQGNSATFDNLNSQEIQQLIFDNSNNKVDIANNTTAINNLQTSLNNDITILEGQVEQNTLNILDNENAIQQIQTIQSQPLNRLIDQISIASLNSPNICVETHFLGNISVNGDISGNTVNTTNILFNGTLTQQPNLNYNFLSKTEISELIVTTSLELPSNVEIPGSNHTSDIQITNAKILQTNIDPNNTNIFTKTDINGSLYVNQNLQVLNDCSLNNLSVTGTCNLPIINSQTINSINSDISTNTNDIATLNNNMVDISNNITILYNEKANLLNPTFPNNVNINNLLTAGINPFVTNDIGNNLSDNNYLCTHKTARDIAESVASNQINNTELDAIANRTQYIVNDPSNGFIDYGSAVNQNVYIRGSGALNISLNDINIGLPTNINNTLYVSDSLTGPTITTINVNITNLQSSVSTNTSNITTLQNEVATHTSDYHVSVFDQEFDVSGNNYYFFPFVETNRPLTYRLLYKNILDEEPAGFLNGVREWTDLTGNVGYIFNFKENTSTGGWNGFYLEFYTDFIVRSRKNNYSADGSTFLSQSTTAARTSGTIRVIVY
jgi:hypothetical protein